MKVFRSDHNRFNCFHDAAGPLQHCAAPFGAPSLPIPITASLLIISVDAALLSTAFVNSQRLQKEGGFDPSALAGTTPGLAGASGGTFGGRTLGESGSRPTPNSKFPWTFIRTLVSDSSCPSLLPLTWRPSSSLQCGPPARSSSSSSSSPPSASPSSTSSSNNNTNNNRRPSAKLLTPCSSKVRGRHLPAQLLWPAS